MQTLKQEQDMPYLSLHTLLAHNDQVNALPGHPWHLHGDCCVAFFEMSMCLNHAVSAVRTP